MPSSYIEHKTWEDLSLDYEMAKLMNEIDQQKEDARYKQIAGK